jgi:hypothetical protein
VWHVGQGGDAQRAYERLVTQVRSSHRHGNAFLPAGWQRGQTLKRNAETPADARRTVPSVVAAERADPGGVDALRLALLSS